MAAHVCSLLVLAVRSACRHPASRPSVRPRGSLGCGPRTLALNRAYSLDSLVSGPGRPLGQQVKGEKPSPSIALAQRNLSAAVAVSFQGQCRPLCRYDFLDLGEVEENTQRAQACKNMRRFIIDPAIADIVTHHLGSDLEESKAIIFECNPGPGVLTKTLLNAGAQRVVALETNKAFLPELRDLEGRLDGQLDVVHCDFFKLDPISSASMRPPAMASDKLFTDLGISEASWADDVPVKVVGIMPQVNERSKMWKMLYTLFERESFYRYGRVELNLFMSEKEYLKMMAEPGDNRNYRAFGVLWQIACEVELLHKEPWSSFVTSNKMGVQKSVHLPNDHLCLVRLTPRRDLFSGHLNSNNASTLIMMVKQCLARRKAPLMDKLNLWGPESGPRLLEQLGVREDISTGQVLPGEYRQLFELMEDSQEFTQSWLYDEILENTQRQGFAT